MGKVLKVAYHVAASREHPSYIVLSNGAWVFPRDVKVLKQGPHPYQKPKRSKLMVKVQSVASKIKGALV